MQNGSLRGPREEYLPNTIVEDPGRTPLHDTAAIGDDKTLEALLTGGADRNAKDAKHGNTPLHEAAWRGYSRCVHVLCVLPKQNISKDLPINGKEVKQLKGVVQDTRGVLHSALLGTRNFGGFSALHLASQNGHNQSCREILLAGGDPDVQNNYGDTPLHTACRYGHAGATRILLSAKCDLQRVNLNGDSPLHIACAMGRRKLTKILLESGSSIDVRNSQNETPRDIAIRKNLSEIVDILDKPLPEIRRERELSSSSSHRNKRSEGKSELDRIERTSKERKSKEKDSKTKHKEKPKDLKAGKDIKSGKSADKTDNCEVNPKHWSPYGCHYYPDPRDFPQPKLETLPKDPLRKGEQYFLDLAGNICKGPVGVGNTCYCAPFFRHLEEKIIRNRKSLRKYVDRATEKIDSKVAALALRTDDQIEELTRSMLTERIRCEDRRYHLEHWLKRGATARTTLGQRSGGPLPTSKSKKDQLNNNTLTRCRSLELLDSDKEMAFGTGKIETSTPGMSRSVDLLESHDVIVHHDAGYGDEIDSSGYSRQSGGRGDGSGFDHVSSVLMSNSERERQHSGRDSSQLANSSMSKKNYSLEKERSSSVSDREKHIKLTGHGSGRSSSFEPVAGGAGIVHRKNKHNKSFTPEEMTPATQKKESSKSVSARLEKLLSRTNEIIEMEKNSRRRTSDMLSSLLSPDKSKKRDKKLKEPLKILPASGDDSVYREGVNRRLSYEDDLLIMEQLANGMHTRFASADVDIEKDFDNSEYIAKEMERITRSLLGDGCDDALDECSNKSQEPAISPEIRKEDENFKENDVRQSESHTLHEITPKNDFLGSMADVYIPDFNRDTRREDGDGGSNQLCPEELDQNNINSRQPDVNGVATNFEKLLLENKTHDLIPDYDPHQTGYNIPNGFYQNYCFGDEEEEEVPSSSNNTLKSEKLKLAVVPSNSFYRSTNDSLDVDDRCELAEMANLRELNELKSRILNGSQWRSQVMRKSVNDVVKEYNKDDPDEFDLNYDIDNGENVDGFQMQMDCNLEMTKKEAAVSLREDQNKKYEIKNSEIKTLKTTKAQKQHSDSNALNEASYVPTRNKVHELVAQIQGTKVVAAAQTKKLYKTFEPVYSESAMERVEHSESSEDEEEEEMQFREVDGSIMSNYNEGATSHNFYQYPHQNLNYFTKNHQTNDAWDQYLQNSVQGNSDININNYDNNSYNQNANMLSDITPGHVNYSRPLPQVANYRTGLSQQSNNAGVYPRVIDTRCLIPKDAYFHELPNKNRMIPITDKLPEKQLLINNKEQFHHIASENYSARNRNPLPYGAIETDMLVNGNYNYQHTNSTLTNVAYLTYQLPANATTASHILSNNATPIHSDYNHPIKVVPHREKLLTNRKFGYSNVVDMELSRINSHHTDITTPPATNGVGIVSREGITIDQAQIERDMHNDSGYSTKICGSSHGPSPSLSGQTDYCDLSVTTVIAKATPPLNNRTDLDATPVNGLTNNNQQQQQQYNEYYISNIGASSLV